MFAAVLYDFTFYYHHIICVINTRIIQEQPILELYPNISNRNNAMKSVN